MKKQQHQVDKFIHLFTSQSEEEIYQALLTIAEHIPFQLSPLSPNSIPAAILIPIITHPQEPTLLLTQRTSHLRHHASQVSFPGGKIDENDNSPKACALREMNEEIGIPPENVEILGCLGQWPSYSGYVITPFVGLISPPLQIKRCEHEVEEVFEISFNDAFNINRYQPIFKKTPTPHNYYETIYDNKRIWGFTANILVLLAKFLEY